MTRALDLFPCPFCQSTDLLLDHPKWFVWCQACDTFGPTGDTMEAAAALWNTRYPVAYVEEEP